MSLSTKNMLKLASFLLATILFIYIIIIICSSSNSRSTSIYLHNHVKSRPSLTIRKFSSYHNHVKSRPSLTIRKFTYHNNILYLTQTEKCLPKYLKSPEVIGNTTACQCDVLVLSYKEECKDTSLPHVKYIFQPFTTWTTGRNLLYATSKARDKFYLYYIFMDDDITIHVVEKSDSNPWRMFEDVLRSTQPPIAVVDPLLTYNNIPKPKGCESGRVTKFAQVSGFDAMFNAFHYQAVEHILPYPTKFDNVSWWYSQMFVIIICDVKFHGQVVGDTRLKANNTKHRPYPRENKQDAFKVMALEVENEIPEQYKDISEPILQQWMKTINWSPGYYYCNRVPTPNTLITHGPYKGI